jgi:thiamine biosynthesis lipoprotein
MYNKFYKTIVNVILTVVLFVIFYGCKTPQETKLQRYEFGEPYMGTWWRIVLYAPKKELAETAVKAAFKRIAELDNKFSDYYAETELMQLCYKSGKGEVKVSEDLYDIIEKSISIAKKTDGAFDITAGPCVQLWRWSGRHNQLPSDEKLKAALKLIGYENVKLNRKNQTITLLREGMRLDLCGIAKGYCADIALNVLR